MLPSFAQRRAARVLTLLLAGLVLAGLAPQGSTSAQGARQIQFLDNTQGDFANGSFERTSISSEDNPSLPEDDAGAVQLAPAGVLSPWGRAVEGMPNNISNYGLVPLGDYLFTVGGELGGELGGARADKVYRAKINRVSGSPDASTLPVWKEFTVPAEQAVLLSCRDRDATASGRTRNGAASLQLPAGGNLGYIYVIGGFVDTECASDITTPLVQIATVNASGDITGWVKAPYLPTVNTGDGTLNTTNPRGVADPMVTIVRTSTNERFLYVIGGVGVDTTSSTPRRSIYNSVLYAKINVGNGTLINPLDGSTAQPWAAAAPVDFVDTTKTGLRDGIAVSARATRVNNNSTPPVIETVDAILLAGGCHTIIDCSDRHPNVLKATITNPSTGAIAWDNTPSTNNVAVSLPARAGLGGAFYNGKLYLVGGTLDGTTAGGTATVPTALFDSNLNAFPVSNSNDFFVGTSEPVLPSSSGGDTGSRTDLSVAVMPALPPQNQTNVTVNAAWIFAGGGYNSSLQNARTNTLILGKIGGDNEAADTVRARDGWYYTSIEPVSINNSVARVLSLRWSATVDRSANPQADIRVEFRKTITADRQCDEDDFSGNASDQWRLIDGDTTSAFYTRSNTNNIPYNIVELDKAFPTETFEATCLQFRAQFLQNGVVNDQEVPNPAATPALFSFSLEKALIGAPDIKLNELNASRTSRGSIRDVTVAIQNLADGGLSETLSVVDVTNKGSFFVHLCLAKGPLNSASFPALELQAPGGGGNKPACAVAYYEVFNSQMSKGAQLALPANGWRNPNPPYSAVDLRDLFNEPGKYRFGVVIDYANVIPETSTGEVNNRGERTGDPNGQTVDIEITAGRSYELSLPIINR